MSVQPFDRVVREHGATVLRVCRAVVGAGDADDAWSETFVSALRAYPQLPSTANVQAWLVTIAHRKAIDLLRARGRRASPVAEVPEPGVVAAHSDGAEPGSADTGPDLGDAVRALPERQRLAVAYHYLGGLRHAETAALIGGTEASVRRAAADGIRNLRRAVGRVENDGNQDKDEEGR